MTSRVAAAAVKSVSVKLGIVRSNFLTAALHGCEASKVAQGSFLKIRSACASAVWSRKMPLAHSGAVLSLVMDLLGVIRGLALSGVRRFLVCQVRFLGSGC